jgi:DNA-binding phage protein
MSMETVLEDIFYSKDLIKNDEIVSKFCHNVLTATNDDFF